MSEENSNLQPHSKNSEKVQNGGGGDATLDPAGTSGADLDLGLAKDSDLNSLHGDPRFDAPVRHAQERGTAAQKTN
jgi:hypothetical protein